MGWELADSTHPTRRHKEHGQGESFSPCLLTTLALYAVGLEGSWGLQRQYKHTLEHVGCRDRQCPAWMVGHHREFALQRLQTEDLLLQEDHTL